MHPFVAYMRHKDDEEVTAKTFCVISDCTRHKTDTVYTFQKEVVKILKKEHAALETIHYFTERSAHSTKTNTIFATCVSTKKTFSSPVPGISVTGKGPCDVVGGTVKRLTARTSLMRPTGRQITVTARDKKK